MKISKKAYYGLRAMVYLASNKGIVSIHTMAREEYLPEEYLEKIVQKLRSAGLVEATKGQGGGYSLALEPRLITANHILKVLDGSLVPFPCSSGIEGDSCSQESSCATSNVWKKLSLALEDTLDSITLADLIR
ncbi:MAG: Rrf2 family transcriptional regulator [Candidatus Moranbacteria bacterium]|nr:Rrf2 family transcriptional regulator [Candidatus Moranbacteria bacterium]